MVEHNLAKVGVAGSNPVFRSTIFRPVQRVARRPQTAERVRSRCADHCKTPGEYRMTDGPLHYLFRNRRSVGTTFRRMTRLLAAVASAAAVFALLGLDCAASGGRTTVERAELDVAPGALIEIAAEATEINLTRSSGRTLSVTASLYHRERIYYLVRPMTPAPAERLRVTVDVLPGNEDRAGARLDIAAPDDVSLEIVTTKRKVKMTGVSLKSAAVTTSNAGVYVADSEAALSISTSGAAVDVTGHSGTISVVTTNANVTYAGLLSGDAHSSLQTSNGSIKARIDPRSDVTVRAETGAGVVKGRGLSEPEQSEGVLSGRVGDGGGTLQLTTSVGNIDVVAGIGAVGLLSGP